MHYGLIVHILPFIRNSRKLKIIELHKLTADHEVNVFALNEERRSGGGSLLLRLPEPQYLRAKWKPKNLNLSHMIIARYIQKDF